MYFILWLEFTHYLNLHLGRFILVDEEYDITLSSYGLGTGTQTRIESDCGNFQKAIVQGMI